MTRFSTLILSAALMLGACGESQNSAKTQSGDPAAKTAETPSAAQTQAQTSAQAQAQEPTKTKETAKAETSDETQTAKISQAEPMVLSWEDLMPVGEEALLAEMYTNYYEDLESKMLASSKSLSEASENPDAFDINSITGRWISAPSPSTRNFSSCLISAPVCTRRRRRPTRLSSSKPTRPPMLKISMSRSGSKAR